MKAVKILGLVVWGNLLAGCTSPAMIHNQSLQDKVIACGAGYSDNATGSLVAAYHQTAPSGELTTDFKENARTIIFKELPPEARLKGYEDYIKCIQSDWRHHCHHPHKD